jgi:quercetin dioxygenase-like cupin family protein
MSNPFDMADSCPTAMTITKAGSGIVPAPDGISNAPFQVQMLLSSKAEGEMTAMRAFLNPGVVTHWHSHPRGQLLFVIDGVGLVQRHGGTITEVRAGDSVWFAPDERHWHGASPASPFSYISVQCTMAGTAVHWNEPVEATGDPS